MEPGRSCPLHYRYGAEALSRPAEARVGTLLVVGGLYGNVEALSAILERFRVECRHSPGPVRLVFNGDMHWFDADPDAFARINEAVAVHTAIQGNVEAELADASGAGCGCGYPDYVDAAAVERSNRIMERLREVIAQVPGARDVLAAAPMHRVFDVAGARVGVIHGDPDQLAGWRLATESLAPADEALRAALGCTDQPLTDAEQMREYFQRSAVDVFASTHTCLPVAQAHTWADRAGAVINNGSAGMPNFRGDPRGLITRISAEPAADALYGVECRGVHCQAVAVDYDTEAWRRRFLAWWPAGSSAHESYYQRIRHGPAFSPAQAARGVMRV